MVTEKPSETRKAPIVMSAVVVLDQPIDVGGVQTDKITMRRPKVKDRLIVERDMGIESEADREMRYIANLTGLLPEDLEELLMSDYEKLTKQLRDFRSGTK